MDENSPNLVTLVSTHTNAIKKDYLGKPAKITNAGNSFSLVSVKTDIDTNKGNRKGKIN
jgi:hypothetical protein